MSYQEAVAIPILFELACEDNVLQKSYSNTESFHKKVAEWFPNESARLAKELIGDRTQTKQYNWIRQAIRKLNKWSPRPIDWQRKERISINEAGLRHLHRWIAASRVLCGLHDSAVIENVAIGDLRHFIQEMRADLRPHLMSHVRTFAH